MFYLKGTDKKIDKSVSMRHTSEYKRNHVGV